MTEAEVIQALREAVLYLFPRAHRHLVAQDEMNKIKELLHQTEPK
jgi:hypothetical protein